MIKIIGIKELQTNTKRIREEVGAGMSFVVIWRSKPVFEITPINVAEFAYDMEATGLYRKSFLKDMEKAQSDVKKGKTKTFASTSAFLKSL